MIKQTKVFIPDNQGGGTWETWKDDRPNYKAHAEALAEALRDCVTSPGALAERSHEYALRRLATITATAREALAKWEGAK